MESPDELVDESRNLRILVVGAGALGGYFGGRLLTAGRDVTFLVRPQSAQRLAAEGLRVLSPKGDLTLPHPPLVLAEELAASAVPFDLILLSCKAHDLDGAMDSFAVAVGPRTAILPLLNGMAHLASLDQRFGREHVLGGGCVISATRDADGTIRHLNSLDRLFFGDRDDPESARMHAVTATLSNAGFMVECTPAILREMWQKWTFIAASAGITCLLRASVGDIVAAGGVPLAMQLFSECTEIAVREGFPPAPAFIEQSSGYLTRAGSSFTASMLRDLEAGGPIEAQQIVGDLLDRAERHRLATPLLKVAHVHLRCYEERRRRGAEAAS